MGLMPLSFGIGSARLRAVGGWGFSMKLYRVNKLAKPGGMVLKKKHVLARSDADAVEQAEQSDDCPVCDVLRDGQRVGQVL
jgi:hypothetical protein